VQMVKLRGGVDQLNGILNYMVLWYRCFLFCPVPNTLFNIAAAGPLNYQAPKMYPMRMRPLPQGRWWFMPLMTAQSGRLSALSYEQIMESARSLQPREFSTSTKSTLLVSTPPVRVRDLA
jgi:hypothetical protein